MSINLEKYKDLLISAWKDVVDDKSNTDWALFSYEGQTNDLKVVSKGDGGIDEMREDLNSGKIMYAFCRVLDPKTSLQKFVLVNWQGEGAPHHRKATSANHIRDVSNLLKGFHVTVNARNEEEVDADIIVEKLSKATASAFSFKDRGEVIRESGPVGTTYKRVIPQQEINSNERDKFWQKEQEEEKTRQETERNRKDEERKKLEKEIKQREIEETAQREARIKERSKSISVLREAERNEVMRTGSVKSSQGGDDIADREREDMERKGRSDILRRQRSQEAQQLISKRTIDARAVFEQNTSAGQLLQRRASYQPTSTTNPSVMSPVKEKTSPIEEKVRWPPEQQIVSPPAYTTPTPAPAPAPVSTPTPLPEQRPPSPPTSSVPVEESEPVAEEASLPLHNMVQEHPLSNGSTEHAVSVNGNGEIQSQEIVSDLERAQPYAEELYMNTGAILEGKPVALAVSDLERAQPYADELYMNTGAILEGKPVALAVSDLERAQPYAEELYMNTGAILEDYEDLDLRAQALYDYQAADDTEISFDPGDIITRIDQIDAGWWQGMAPDGSYGLFPANYVQLLD